MVSGFIRRTGEASERFFFFNDTATTEIYTLSLHDALPISGARTPGTTIQGSGPSVARSSASSRPEATTPRSPRSEEHTSELQSRSDLVCRLLLEKKKEPRAEPERHAEPVRKPLARSSTTER